MLALVNVLYELQIVPEPFDGGARDSDRAFQRIDGRTFRAHLIRDSRDQSVGRVHPLKERPS